MSNRDVPHIWQPSERLRNLAARVGVTPPLLEQPSMTQDALTWLRERGALASSKQMHTRILSIMRYQLRGTSISELRRRTTNSWIHDGRVVGDLALIRNLGPRVFAELQRLIDAH